MEVVVDGSSALSAVTFCSVFLAWTIRLQLVRSERALEREQSLRMDERRGRIRLQQAQRDCHPQHSQLNGSSGFHMKEIGVVRSQYSDRRGTPRQPSLVVSSRGRVQFNKQIIQHEHFKELSEFTHIWILWVFHKNTNLDSKSISAKVHPPRLHGTKVGCLSTRSPHRPNPIGLSVAEIVRVGKDFIDIKSVDMVDGTPVLDIKPYIPHDIVSYDKRIEMAAIDDETGSPRPMTHLQVPSWIVGADVPMRKVELSLSAAKKLQEMEEQRQFIHCSGKHDAISLIKDVLRQDIRSSHQGRGNITQDRGDCLYECRLDAFIVKFRTFSDKIFVEQISMEAVK